MNSTLLDLYSRETFRDVGRVFRTCNNFDYSPIVFIYENAFRTVIIIEQTPKPEK
ncbi:MAG: hypothetical protein ACTTKB_08165 [Treponema sp.]